MRLIVSGGWATESSKSKGSVVVGVRTLSEAGRVGNFLRSRYAVYLYLICEQICPILFNVGGDSFLFNNALYCILG